MHFGCNLDANWFVDTIIVLKFTKYVHTWLERMAEKSDLESYQLGI